MGISKIFPKTQWTLIKKTSSKNKKALKNLINIYDNPCRQYLKIKGITLGIGLNEIEDIEQSFFLRHWKNEGSQIAKADKNYKTKTSKVGKFRYWFMYLMTSFLRESKKAKSKSAETFGPIDEISLTDSSTSNHEAELSKLLAKIIVTSNVKILKEKYRQKAILRLRVFELYLTGLEIKHTSNLLKISEDKVKNERRSIRRDLATLCKKDIANHSGNLSERAMENLIHELIMDAGHLFV